MLPLIDTVRWVTIVILCLLFLAVPIGFVRSESSASGFLQGVSRPGRRFASTGRTQLLLATFATAFHYLLQVARQPGHFPDISSTWLVFFGASQAFYLGSKYSSLRQTNS